jgi:hypothetical protein
VFGVVADFEPERLEQAAGYLVGHAVQVDSCDWQVVEQYGVTGLADLFLSFGELAFQPGAVGAQFGAAFFDVADEVLVDVVGEALAACVPLDVSCQISQAVTGWFAGLVNSAINPVLTVIGQDLLSTPQPGSFPAVAGMWGTSLAIANAFYVLLVLAGGIVVMGYETVQVSTSAKEIAPRLGLGLAVSNLSLILTSHAVSLANGLAAALAGQGADPQTAGAALANTIRNSISTGGIFVILLALVAVILALVLAVTYVLRLMGLILLTAVAPLVLACYALPQTAWAARWWWRAMTALLVIPAAQALVLTAAVKVFFLAGAGGAGGVQGGRELPQIGLDQGGIQTVAAGGQGDPHGGAAAGRAAEHVAGLAQRDVALAGPVARRGSGPQRLADRIPGRAVGTVDGEEGQQLASLAGAGADLAVRGGDLQRAEHADPDRPVRFVCQFRQGWSSVRIWRAGGWRRSAGWLPVR